MRFKELYLVELAAFRLMKNGSNYISVFEVEGIDYIFLAKLKDNIWNISFAAKNDKNSFTDEKVSTKKSITVFKTVEAILDQFIKKENPEYFILGMKKEDKSTRYNIYLSKAKRLEKDNLYKISKINDNNKTIEIVMKRTKDE